MKVSALQLYICLLSYMYRITTHRIVCQNSIELFRIFALQDLSYPKKMKDPI